MIVEAVFVAVTLDADTPLNAEQRQMLGRATDTKREYGPEEVLRVLEEQQE